MRTDEAIRFFGGKKALADALGVWPQVIYQWGEHPPMARQYELEVKTNGVLKAEKVERDGEQKESRV
jgi:transcriptional repressor of cell division inhibition gene dicB